MSRPPGVLWSSSSPRFTLTLALVVSTVAELAATVTVSCTPDTFSVKSTGEV